MGRHHWRTVPSRPLPYSRVLGKAFFGRVFLGESFLEKMFAARDYPWEVFVVKAFAERVFLEKKTSWLVNQGSRKQTELFGVSWQWVAGYVVLV